MEEVNVYDDETDRLNVDMMRHICSFLENDEELASVARVGGAWRHALKNANQDFWKKEWDRFVAEHGTKPWFTTDVYDYPPEIQSNLSGLLNGARKFIGKDEKDHKSFRQRIYSKQILVKNPTYVELLLVNRQHQLKAMSDEERSQFFQKLNEERPSLRTGLKDLAAIPGSAALAVIGVCLLPPGLIVQGVKMIFTGIPKRSGGGGCGENAGVGIAQAAAEYWPIVPTALCFYQSYSLIMMFGQDTRESARQLKVLYDLTKNYIKDEK